MLTCEIIILTSTLLQERTAIVTMLSTMLGDKLAMECSNFEVRWVLL